MTTLSEYQSAYQEAHTTIVTLESELAVKESENQILREKLRLLQYRQFGKSSERLTPEAQELMAFLNSTPSLSVHPIDSDLVHVPAHTKKKPGRRPISPGLPREERICDLPEIEKTCFTHGILLTKIGEERSESVEHVPQSFKIIVTIRPKYLCLCCEEKTVHIASVEPKLIPKGIATPSLLAHVVLSKFADHLPLYRLESIFSREGFDLTRGTMAEWMIRLGEALVPITNLLQEEVLAGSYVSCDETPLRVLTDDGKPVKNLHYLWIRSRPKEFGPPIYLFEYASSRRAQVAKEILEGFPGYLQVDQYAGYDFTEKLAGITRVGCFAHVRRKFFEAQKASKDKKSISGRVLKLIKKLYQIDEAMKDVSSEHRTLERRSRSLPVLEELKTFLEESQRQLPPQSATGKAIAYALNSWSTLLPVYNDHRIRLDNNLTENAIRPVAVGRKNYLFCQSPEGAAAAARIYSVIATARANGLDLREYLIRLIDGLPRAKSLEDFEALLPHST